jgi:hypothetical protein
MIDLLFLLIVFFSGYYSGRMSMAWKIRHLLFKGDTLQTENVIVIDKLFIEQSNNTMYLYDFEANTFICQGQSIDELASLSHKYKNIKYAVVQHGDEMLSFVNGKVTTKA